MKVAPEDLSLHLKKSLKGWYILAGDEPLQYRESLDLIRQALHKDGFTERESFDIQANFDWDRLLAKLNMLSLFSEKQLLECHFKEGALTKAVSEKLLILKDRLLTDPSLKIILTFEKLSPKDQQSAWFNALEPHGCFTNLRALTAFETRQWLTRHLAMQAISLQPDAFDLLLERTEGNLSATAQALEKLKMSGLTQAVATETLLEIVALETRFTVFDLIDAILGGHLKRTSQILHSLQDEGVEPILVVWAIAREVRTILKLKHQIKIGKSVSNAFNEQGIWKRREPLVRSFLQHKTTPQLHAVLSTLNHIDDVIKGRVCGNTWDLLCSVCLNLTDFSGSTVCLVIL
jgi:DNA polymerase-3 subunit delta